MSRRLVESGSPSHTGLAAASLLRCHTGLTTLSGSLALIDAIGDKDGQKNDNGSLPMGNAGMRYSFHRSATANDRYSGQILKRAVR